MKKLLAYLMVLVCDVVTCAHSYAQDCQLITEAKPDATCLVFFHNDVRGVWFAEGRAANILRNEKLMPELKLQISKQADIQSILEKQAATDRMIEESQRLEIDKLEKALVTSESRASKCEENQGSWLRSPVLWAAVGFVGGSVLVGIVAATR